MVDLTPELSSDVEWRPDLRWHFIATRKRCPAAFSWPVSLRYKGKLPKTSQLFKLKTCVHQAGEAVSNETRSVWFFSWLIKS
ncbi:hypothetical protein GQ600_18143 [Phytophthora cactorum]|nr:hypothetical protein GQ600_18143 [Phytophthora cactorum]